LDLVFAFNIAAFYVEYAQKRGAYENICQKLQNEIQADVADHNENEQGLTCVCRTCDRVVKEKEEAAENKEPRVDYGRYYGTYDYG
jgi:hypothetical protein